MQKEQKIQWDYRSEINKALVSGTMLLSEPFMVDPSFIRSTCLIVNHVKKEGTFGFVLNKLTDHNLSDFVDLNDDIDFEIFYGGPVQTDALFFIHNNEFNLTNAHHIKDDLYWNGDFEELLEKINMGIVKSDDVKFFLGYSGWDGGQLRKEIIENSWIINNDTILEINGDYKKLWKKTLETMGGVYKKFASFPIDPSLN